MSQQAETTITIDSFDIFDISEGLFTGPKGEFRFKIYIIKLHTNESYKDANRIVDLPSLNDYYSWDKGNHKLNHKIVLDNIKLERNDLISINVSGIEIDDASEDDILGSNGDTHVIYSNQNDKHSIVNQYYSMNYTIVSKLKEVEK